MRFGKTLLVLECDGVEPMLYPLARKDLVHQGPRYVVQVGDKVSRSLDELGCKGSRSNTCRACRGKRSNNVRKEQEECNIVPNSHGFEK